jgi:hypothetical protein
MSAIQADSINKVAYADSLQERGTQSAAPPKRAASPIGASTRGVPPRARTYRVVRHVAGAAGLSCETVKVEWYQRMAERGIVATPAIAIDGGVFLSGPVPNP